MKYFLTILLLVILFLTFIFSLAIFIDRTLISSSGFSSLLALYSTYLLLVFSIVMFILALTIIWPTIFATSSVGLLLIYHICIFFLTNFILIFLTNMVLFVDYIIKSRLKKLKFNIITCNSINYKTLLKNKKFLKIIIVISYFISTILILFPVPCRVLSIIQGNASLTKFISTEIKTYQQLFVFSTIPVLFSILKND